MDLGEQREMMILLCEQGQVQTVFSLIVYQQKSAHDYEKEAMGLRG